MATFTLIGQTVSGDPLVSGGNITITTSLTPELTFTEIDDVLGDPLSGEFVSYDGGVTQLSYQLLGYGLVRGDTTAYAAFIRIDLGGGTFETVAIDMNADGDRQPDLLNGNTKLRVADLAAGAGDEAFPPPPCFTPGTVIATAEGPRELRHVRVGDRVLTRDSGFQAVRWIGARRFSRDEIAANPHLAPIVVRKHTVGGLDPNRPLVVSPQHRVLLHGADLDLTAGTTEALVPAAQLLSRDGVFRRSDTPVTYMHLLFDRHEVVLSNGVWTESFQPNRAMLTGLDVAARRELLEIFPDIGPDGVAESAFQSARPTLNRFETEAVLAPRLAA